MTDPHEKNNEIMEKGAEEVKHTKRGEDKNKRETVENKDQLNGHQNKMQEQEQQQKPTDSTELGEKNAELTGKDALNGNNKEKGKSIEEESTIIDDIPEVVATNSKSVLNGKVSPTKNKGRKLQKNLQAGCKEVSSACRDVKDKAMSFSCRDCVRSTCTLRNVKQKLPILNWLPKYRCPEFQGDLIAGLTVGLTVIPQGLAYAQIAELPPQYGLYSAFMGCFMYCLFGTSKDITLGPTAIMSLMTAEFGHGSVPISIILTFMCGIVQILMGIFYLGFLVDFIPVPVINSFTVAAAITIACGQIKKWLGITVTSRAFVPQLIGTFANIKQTNIWDFVLGLICMIILYIMKRIKNMKWRDDSEMSKCFYAWKKFVWILTTARNAVVVLVASGVAAGFDVYDLTPFSLTGNITAGLPDFEPPPFGGFYDDHTNTTMSGLEALKKIGGGLAIIPLMGVVESIAIGNAFARKNNYKIDANQELLAIGISNLAGSFVKSYPVTGSFSRTAVNSQSGVRTTAGGIWTGALILIALGLLTPLFKYIPSAALAGVIIMAVLDMVSFQLLKKLWRIKKLDLLPWFVCFILSFALGIEWGIIGGVGFALLLLLHPWARPAINVIKDLPTSDLFPPQDILEKELTVIQFNQGLLYPGVEYVKEKVVEIATADGPPRSVVLDCSHLSNVDYSAIQGFQGLTDDFEALKCKVIFTHLQPPVLEVIQKANIQKLRYCSTNDEAIQTILEEHTVLPEEGTEEDNPRQALIGKGSTSDSVARRYSPTSGQPRTHAYGATTSTSSSPRRSLTGSHASINDEVRVDVEKNA